VAENYEAYTRMVRLGDKTYFVTYAIVDGKPKIINREDITDQVIFFDVSNKKEYDGNWYAVGVTNDKA